MKAIFEHNVLPFDGGRMGAINGMRPDGFKDVSSCQSDEFWTGVTYALSADMMQEVRYIIVLIIPLSYVEANDMLRKPCQLVL